jgi:hypothetical protein
MQTMHSLHTILQTKTTDMTVGMQLLIESTKAVMALIGAYVITILTLRRADRRDILTRQAAALDRYSTHRTQSLDTANSSLGKIRLNLTLLASVYDIGDDAQPAELDDHTRERVMAALQNIDSEIDTLLLSCESYGRVPGTIPCDWLDVGEAIIVWTAPLYTLIATGMVNAQRYRDAYKMCSDLQVQLRWLRIYELDMQLAHNANPGGVWNTDHIQVLESKPLPFLFNPEKATIDTQSRPVENASA